MSTYTFRKTLLFRSIAYTVLTSFIGLLPAQPSYAQVSIIMPPPGMIVHITNHFEPPQMVGIKIDLKDPFSFDFIMDRGQNPMPEDVQKEEFNKIIKYFLVSLAMPNKDMWVNLSPYESKRIIPEIFAQTEMGRDLLAQDYVLKQLTASLIYPEDGLGRKFWDKVYEQAQARFGTTEISVNTFNKVWIVADHADVYQKDNTAFLIGSHLKVMLEQDYKAISKNKEQFGSVEPVTTDETADAKTQMASELVREIILPAIEKEVNEGKSFAAVRQVYNAQIMATWFKRTLRESLLGQVFADKSKIAGQRVSDPQAMEKIYHQYLRAYKKGVFNYIREDATPDGQTIPRKYFSGGWLSPKEDERNTPVYSRQIRTEDDTTDFASWPKPARDEAVGRLNNFRTQVRDVDLTDHRLYNAHTEMGREIGNPGNTPSTSGFQNNAALAQIDQQAQRPSYFDNALENLATVRSNLNENLPRLAAAERTVREHRFESTPAASIPLLGRVRGLRDEVSRLRSESNRLETQIIVAHAAERARVDQGINDLQEQIKNYPTDREAGADFETLKNQLREFQSQRERLNIIEPRVNAVLGSRIASARIAKETQLNNLVQARDFAPSTEALDVKQPDLEPIDWNIAERIAALRTARAPIVNARENERKSPGYVARVSPIARQVHNDRVAQGGSFNVVEYVNNIMAASSINTSIEQLQSQTQEMRQAEDNIRASNVVRAQIREADTRSIEVTNRIVESKDNVLSAQKALAVQIFNIRNNPGIQDQDRKSQITNLVQAQNGSVTPEAVSAIYAPVKNPGVQYEDLDMQYARMAVRENPPAAVNELTEVQHTQGVLRQQLERHFTAPRRLAGVDLAALTIPRRPNTSFRQQQRQVEFFRPKRVGGINLSDENLTISIKVDGAGMPLPAQYQDPAMVNISGLTSIIRSIVPLSPENIPPALNELLR